MKQIHLALAMTCFVISANSFAKPPAPKDAFRTALDSDYPETVRKESRTPSYKLDLDCDGKEDIVLIQINETTKQSRAVLLLTQKDGTKKETVLKDQPLQNGKVDLTLSLKKSGEPGVSERKYFDGEEEISDTPNRANYKKALAIEVSYDQDFCTTGFIYKDKELKRYEVCD